MDKRHAVSAGAVSVQPLAKERLAEIRSGLRRGPRAGRSFRQGASVAVPDRPVGYFYDVARPAGPVWLAMLLHEQQDRERFDPDAFE